ncbi:hypothetical protein [Dapis sp. BLCC M172]|uniref:hypothetical protein n=1 Tax=Dapis sp. BLCC M172 TaxID=2975281 RepID=UPI003CFB4AF4
MGRATSPFKVKCFWRVAHIPVTKTYVANPTAPLSVGANGHSPLLTSDFVKAWLFLNVYNFIYHHIKNKSL